MVKISFFSLTEKIDTQQILPNNIHSYVIGNLETIAKHMKEKEVSMKYGSEPSQRPNKKRSMQ